MINEEVTNKRFYLISWIKPLGNDGYMGCIVDMHGRLKETINNLFVNGNPTKDFTVKCDRYNIKGKTQGSDLDHFIIGSSPSIKNAISQFKKEMGI